MIQGIRTAIFAGGIALALAPSVSEAQIFTPTYLSPTSSSDKGVYFSDGPGDYTFEGILRGTFAGLDMGARAGLGDANAAGMALLAGADLRYPVEFGGPLDMAVSGAAQILKFTDAGSAVGFSAGLTMGHNFVEDELRFSPYIHPQLTIVSGGNSTNVDLGVDIGFDARVTDTVVLRLGIPFDSDMNNGIGFGVAWR
jgi:hypothetical protein